MKTKLLLVTALLLWVFILPAYAYIVDVEIHPEEPTYNDNISIDVFGEESGSMGIVGTSFIVDEMFLELNIDIKYGFLTVITPWTHTEDIGTLPIGTYDLTVNMFVDSRPDLDETYIKSFEVVPEPATILLVGAGFLGIRKYNS